MKVKYLSINNYKNIPYWLQWCSLNSHWWQTYHLPVLLSKWESKDDVPSVSAQENEINYTLGCCIYHHNPMLISYIALVLLFIPSIVSIYWYHIKADLFIDNMHESKCAKESYRSLKNGFEKGKLIFHRCLLVMCLIASKRSRIRLIRTWTKHYKCIWYSGVTLRLCILWIYILPC